MNAFGAQLQNKAYKEGFETFAIFFYHGSDLRPLQSWLLMGQEGHVRAAVRVLLASKSSNRHSGERLVGIDRNTTGS